MRSLHLLYLALLMLFTVPAQSKAENVEGRSVVISLITCHPGDLTYELYGHSALRVMDLSKGTDYVYNYGIFDFTSDHFVLRFILGKTDYMLGVTTYPYFHYAYASEGRRMDEQELNLTPNEAKRLQALLEENARPENCVYRYNFLEDNCVTRAVDMAVKAIDGKVTFPEAQANKTFRTLVNEHTQRNPWDYFVQNFLLGMDVDTLIGVRGQMFAPLYASALMANAVVTDTAGNTRPLVAKTIRLTEDKTRYAPHPLSPQVVFTVLLVLSIVAVVLLYFGWKKTFAAFETPLLLMQGFVGCILFTLCFFSEHPAVDNNWNLLLLNPLPLLAIPYQWWTIWKGHRNYYPYVQLILLTAYAFGIGMLHAQGVVSVMWLIVAILTILNVGKIISDKRMRK
ncbi:MAG: DUF4105 domain-containing protein [Bacteroidaceae bacterium]|nr:DUF4105 domain-containing protein [Bacteroidaceae bacterium]